ncbi:Epithelial-stromal interaction protein 1 [Labeo rohita]|uniref:Epithelial-stromal interaction protein 1 n=1 Tax=Labeo rohita TaxID=84645 RepID=A0ABQ8MC16_LABRO|nr:Epithelial-stromal interaction protein 1 [Labeo rohita]
MKSPSIATPLELAMLMMTDTPTETPEGQTSFYSRVLRFQNRGARFSDPTHRGVPYRERLANKTISNSLPVPAVSCFSVRNHATEYTSMNRSTQLTRNSGRSGGYRENTINQRSNMTDSEQTNECCEKNLPSTSNPQNEPVHADGYTKIPPNESRRSKTQRIAQKEEEDLRRWKEENRPGPIQLPPEKLGGAVSLAEVRQRQQMESRQSKMRKKQRQEEMDKKKRQAEEEQIEQMKAKQREKANQLEMRKKQEDVQRQKQYQHDKQINSIPASSWVRQRPKMHCVLHRPEFKPLVHSCGTEAKSHEYKEARREEENTDLLKKKEEQRRKADILEEKQKQQEEDRKRRTEADHRRVNLAFLDRLEASSSGRVPEPVTQTPESSSVWLDEDDDDDIDEPQDTALSNPSQIHADRSEADALLETSPSRRLTASVYLTIIILVTVARCGCYGQLCAELLCDGVGLIDGLTIYPAFLGSVCMGHLSAIVLVLSISVWFSVGSRCRCLRNRLAEALRWRRALPPCLSCSMNQMNQQGDGDHTWTLMKLQNRFPYYERDMLEEIVKQCDGNYQKAYELLDV